MFGDQIRIKALLMGFFGYVLVSTLVMGVVVHYRLPSGVTDPQQLARLVEGDFTLLVWQNVLGLLLGIGAGFASTYFSGSAGLRNALVLGMLFSLYGVFGIYLHPSHPLAMQIGKLVSPIPIALFGGWLRLRLAKRGTGSGRLQGTQADAPVSGGPGV